MEVVIRKFLYERIQNGVRYLESTRDEQSNNEMFDSGTEKPETE